MKLQIPLWLVALALMALWVWSIHGQFNTSRVTSDASQTRGGLPMAPMPNGTGIFVPPSTTIFTEFRTSTVPLVVEITVTSNIIRRDVFWMAGKPTTNDWLMTNWVVSKATNSTL